MEKSYFNFITDLTEMFTSSTQDLVFEGFYSVSGKFTLEFTNIGRQLSAKLQAKNSAAPVVPSVHTTLSELWPNISALVAVKAGVLVGQQLKVGMTILEAGLTARVHDAQVQTSKFALFAEQLETSLAEISTIVNLEPGKLTLRKDAAATLALVDQSRLTFAPDSFLFEQTSLDAFMKPLAGHPTSMHLQEQTKAKAIARAEALRVLSGGEHIVVASEKSETFSTLTELLQKLSSGNLVDIKLTKVAKITSNPATPSKAAKSAVGDAPAEEGVPFVDPVVTVELVDAPAGAALIPMPLSSKITDTLAFPAVDATVSAMLPRLSFALVVPNMLSSVFVSYSGFSFFEQQIELGFQIDVANFLSSALNKVTTAPDFLTNSHWFLGSVFGEPVTKFSKVEAEHTFACSKKGALVLPEAAIKVAATAFTDEAETLAKQAKPAEPAKSETVLAAESSARTKAFVDSFELPSKKWGFTIRSASWPFGILIQGSHGKLGSWLSGDADTDWSFTLGIESVMLSGVSSSSEFEGAASMF
jgi:hypothetical protein